MVQTNSVRGEKMNIPEGASPAPTPENNGSISAARKAFEAVDAAIQKAAQMMELLSKCRHVPGATVMIETSGFGSYSKCSECGHSDQQTSGWKFCRYCGCEIIRFERAPENDSKTITVGYAEVKHDPAPAYLKLANLAPKRDRKGGAR
jgi:hypothetical protein